MLKSDGPTESWFARARKEFQMNRKLIVALIASFALPAVAFACDKHDQQANNDAANPPTLLAENGKTKKKSKKPKTPASPKPDAAAAPN